MYYKKDIICKYCDKSFKTTRILPSKVRLERTDSDFCPHYKHDNPMFYEVYMCPHCGYAFNDDFKELSKAAREDLKVNYLDKITVRDFTGVRNLEITLTAYKLALFTSEITQEENEVIADLCLKIAWLNRLAEDKVQEVRFLNYALNHFKKILSEKDLEIEDMNKDELAYMVAELNARTDKFRESRYWFSYLIANPSVTKKYKDIARNRWSEIREVFRDI